MRTLAGLVVLVIIFSLTIPIWLHIRNNPSGPAAAYKGSVKLAGSRKQKLNIGFGDKHRVPVNEGKAFTVTGNTTTTGLITALDNKQHIAGMAVVPKDSRLFQKTDVKIDYRSTAIAMVATTPGMAQPDPVVSAIELGLVASLPQLDTLASCLADQAATDTAYLSHPSSTCLRSLEATITAFQTKANAFTKDTAESRGALAFHKALDSLFPNAYAESGSLLSGKRPGLDKACDQNNGDLHDNDGKESDGVCLKVTEGNTKLQMTNPTARWGLYYIDNNTLPAAAAMPKTWALPSVQQLVSTIAHLAAEDAMASIKKLGGFLGLHTNTDTPAPFLDRLLDAVASWSSDQKSEASLSASTQARTIVAATAGIPRSGDNLQGAAGVQFGVATIATLATQVIVPVVSLVLDAKPQLPQANARIQLLQAVASFVDNHKGQVNDLLSVASGAEKLSSLARTTKLGKVLADLCASSLTDFSLLKAVASYAFRNIEAQITNLLAQQITKAILAAIAGPVGAVKEAIDKGVPVVNLSLNVIKLFDDSWKYGTTDSYTVAANQQAPPAPAAPAPAPKKSTTKNIGNNPGNSVPGRGGPVPAAFVGTWVSYWGYGFGDRTLTIQSNGNAVFTSSATLPSGSSSSDQQLQFTASTPAIVNEYAAFNHSVTSGSTGAVSWGDYNTYQLYVIIDSGVLGAVSGAADGYERIYCKPDVTIASQWQSYCKP